MKKIATLTFLFFNFFSYAQDFDFSSLSIPENLKEDANSVIRFENLAIEIKSQREMTISYQTAITVYNELGNEHANFIIQYDKRRTINNVKATVYDSKGAIVKKIKKGDFRDYSAYDGISLFNDSRLIHYKYTPIAYPFTIYYEYEINTSNTAFIPSWILNGSYSQSVKSAKFSVKYPSYITLFKSEENFKDFEITKTEELGFLSYEIKDLPALKWEPYTPALFEFLPTVKIGIDKFNLEGVDGEALNWKEFGKWYYDNLIQNTLELPEATKLKIKSLTASTSDPVEKAKIVYKYVQDKVRYISVQVGIGGYKPMLASDVDKLGYGDCKALTNYTSALLKEVGVASYHTLIYGGEKRNLNQNIASPQGNHMILYVPIANQDIWLECTSQKDPFAEIAGFTDDRDALVLSPDGGLIKHTKLYKTEDNLQYTKGNITIDGEGNINADVYIESTGTQYSDNLLNNDGKSQKELDMIFKKYLSNINNIKFSKTEVLNNKEAFRFEENLAFTATNYGILSGTQLLIPINAFNNGSTVPPRVRNRKLPFEISKNFLDIDEVKISLPKQLKIEYVPEKVELNTKFGTYSIEMIKIDDYSYLFKRKLKIEAGNYQKEDYESFRDFRKEIAKHDNSKIILIK
ncbi:MAG: DUF3857 domain-containing protein [Bacteroidetes bacterium HGW-Bacteroidetes-3]|jgi:transglutaminase-like putative cysteine protease|nr:MAG: DUF3857 domain-containing protein [Bacteroidetes bacterium HGW-Bacteroidetes-3]